MPSVEGWVTEDIQLLSSGMETRRQDAPCSGLLQPAGMTCRFIGHRIREFGDFCEHVNGE
jgi:hypothetical protein